MKLSLGFAHELGIALAMTASVAIVLLGGELPGFAWLVCLAPWLSWLLAARGIHPPALSATLVGLASVGLAVATLARGGVDTSVLAGGELLMGLLTARLLVRRTPAHDLQAISLSLLLVLAGSVLNVKITYIGVFVIYAVAAVWALSTRQLLAGAALSADGGAAVRKRDDIVTPAFFVATGTVAVLVLVSAAVVFAAFPRVGFGDIGAFMHKETRLPGSVGLRGDPRLGGGTEVVARARGVSREAFERGLYLRGAVYDVINLDGFSQTQADAERLPGFVELAEAPEQARYELTVMPVVGDTLLSLGTVVAVRPLSGGNANPNLTLGVAGRSVHDELKAYGPLLSPLRYDVAGSVAAPGYVPTTVKRKPKPLKNRERWLSVPRGFDDELIALTRTAAGAATTSSGKADGLRRFLLEKFKYSQDPPRFAAQPVRAFLLEQRQGHCEFFAASYALMLRALGIPARVVGGFQGGAWDDDVVVFQEKNAHAWVEWWDDDAGWIVDDATPLATAPREELGGLASLVERARRLWDDQVLDYSLQDQTDAAASAKRSWEGVDPSLKGLVVGLAVPALFGLVLVAVRRRRRRREGDDHPLARAILDAVARTGRTPVPAAATVREAVEGCEPKEPLARALRDALHVYEADRFGGRTAPDAVVRRHRKALREGLRAR